jgi:chemotaxis protein MotB
MARTKHLLVVAGLSLLGLGTGCVSSEKYNAQRMRADAAGEGLQQTEAEMKAEKARGEANSQQAQQFRQMLEAKEAINGNLTKENEDLKLQLADSRHRYESAVANLGKAGGSPLPIALVSELTTFAQQNPDVVEFDDKKGLVKFKSDVTFSAGSAVVKPETKSVIDKFAGILNGPTASQYELMVVGHTDSTPVSNPVTKKAGHLDNWYLSVHRAIAVSQVLHQQGTAAHRIEVAGCADQKPLAPNDTEANKGRNRRVEVFILPTQAGGTPAPTAPVAITPPAAKKPAPAAKVLDKNTGTTSAELDRKFLSK